jgi:hypothetical protein
MPIIFDSPAYRDGGTLVTITLDEGGATDTAASDNEQAGPNSTNPGYSPLLNTPIAAFGGKTYYQLLGLTGLTPGVEPTYDIMPGGGQIGPVLFNPDWITPGSVDTTGSYTPLRTFEDLLGIRHATDFGPDVFTRQHENWLCPVFRDGNDTSRGPFSRLVPVTASRSN